MLSKELGFMSSIVRLMMVCNDLALADDAAYRGTKPEKVAINAVDFAITNCMER